MMSGRDPPQHRKVSWFGKWVSTYTTITNQRKEQA